MGRQGALRENAERALDALGRVSPPPANNPDNGDDRATIDLNVGNGPRQHLASGRGHRTKRASPPSRTVPSKA